MLKKLTISLAAGALALSAPLAAQDDDAEKEEVLGLLEGLFADAEPLTAEQQARMPAAERSSVRYFPWALMPK